MAAEDGDSVGDGAVGYVHSFELVATHDGPGLRFVLFTSGCFLRCQYCHNPDTWHLKHGHAVTLDRVLNELKKYVISLKMLDGGLTITGGEPLVQSQFALRVFRAAKERYGLHTALDTSGYLETRADATFLNEVDLVLLDIKAAEPELYRDVTGVDLEPTLRFAKRLADSGKPVWVRFVLVPGLTDDFDHVQKLADLCASFGNVERVNVLPFHQMGAYKWRELELNYRLAGTQPPSKELLERVQHQFAATGLRVV